MTILKKIWKPDVIFGDIPKYQTIANAIQNDIGCDVLKIGERLPTHRDLAWHLGVTVGTVSRAYAEIERLGLIGGEVGRGTYVRDRSISEKSDDTRTFFPDNIMSAATSETGPINLSHNLPPPSGAEAAMRDTLLELSNDPKLSVCMEYQPHAGMEQHREAGSIWLKKRNVDVSPDNVMVTPGAHNAALCALAAVTNPGDTVIVEQLTFPGSKAIARLLNLRLVAVNLDEEGLCPDSLRQICIREKPKALYCVPALQNPTNSVMGIERINAVANIANEFGLYIVEDDLFALLLKNPPPPISKFIPDLGFLVSSVSKTLSPGSRTGYISVPQAKRNAVISAIRASCWMAPPLSAEITARWIFNGAADKILANNQRESLSRRAMFSEIIGLENATFPEGALHAWLQLPPEWDSARFAAALVPRGIILSSADVFAMPGDEAPNHIRICLGPPKQQSRLKQALDIIKETLVEGPGVDTMSIV